MKEYLSNIRSELKRIDHLMYVSLKHTRTVDVIRSLISRILDTFDLGIEALLEKAKKRRKKLEIPDQPLKRCELIREIYSKDEKILNYIDFYLALRIIYRAKFTRREEYRRHVTMISEIEPEKKVETCIDTLYFYHKKTIEFAEYLQEILL